MGIILPLNFEFPLTYNLKVLSAVAPIPTLPVNFEVEVTSSVPFTNKSFGDTVVPIVVLPPIVVLLVTLNVLYKVVAPYTVRVLLLLKFPMVVFPVTLNVSESVVAPVILTVPEKLALYEDSSVPVRVNPPYQEGALLLPVPCPIKTYPSGPALVLAYVVLLEA